MAVRSISPGHTPSEDEALRGCTWAANLRSTSLWSKEDVPLVSSERRTHILDGDVSGGGHRAGTGRPGKTEFPDNWTDDEIIQAIEQVANDLGASRTIQPNGRIICDGHHRGQDVRVIVERDGMNIVTGFPTNVPTNP